MFRSSLKFLLLSFIIALAWPMGPVSACGNCGTSVTYRSAVLGTGIANKGNQVYEIMGERYYFSLQDNVHVLTRVFDIRQTQSFRFRIELWRDGAYLKNWLSPEYRPGGAWWAETYGWHNFGTLSEGRYEARVMISHNNSAWQQRDTKHFQVGRSQSGYHPTYPISAPYYPPQPYYRQPEYRHNWTKTGAGVQNPHSWYLSISGEKSAFDVNEDIFVLTNLQNIRYVDRFRVKFEIDRGGSRVASHEGVWFYPRGAHWADNFNSYKIGRLPEGDYEVKAFIQINNEGYRQLHIHRYSIKKAQTSQAEYRFAYTYLGSRVSQAGHYEYRMDDARTVFYQDEQVKALSKLEDIRQTDRFRIKHIVYEGNREIRSSEGDWLYPRYNWWTYNYAVSDLGRFQASKYRIKTFVQVNNESYRLVNDQEFTVREREYNYSYGYPWSYGHDPYYSSYPYGYRDVYYPQGWSDPGGQYRYYY